ncbi:MAG TPA: 4Fe-4S dicluster domain-containing protein [Acidobacteriota bacterium]|nr:4Fe-4S dicluster domain-containing protein [Acidobacteriota bacterium]
MAEDGKNEKNRFSRRDFVVSGGAVIAGGALSVASPGALGAAVETKAVSAYPLSEGYLVYDSRKCSGCQSCMLTCALVHCGEAAPSYARIQVARNVFDPYPQDIQIHVCRQCPDPLCVKRCPSGACRVSAENGNVRMIDAEKCVGCKTCIDACPLVPHRVVFIAEARKAAKCDLCADAPYFSKKGGASGRQACVTVCPAGALKCESSTPRQKDNVGYDVNLALSKSSTKAPSGR